MSFRSASYAVVARIFKLIDSNGFTRLLFAPWSGIFTYGPGYTIEYASPDWSDPDMTTGIGFTPDTGVTDQAQTLLYARPSASNDEGAAVVVTADSNVGNPQVATVYAQGAPGVFGQIDAAAEPTRGRATMSAFDAGSRSGNIELVGDATSGRVLVTAFEPPTNSAELLLEAVAATNASFARIVADRIEITSPDINLRSDTAPIAEMANGNNVGFLRTTSSEGGQLAGLTPLVVANTTLVTDTFAVERAGIALCIAIFDFDAVAGGIQQAVGEILVNGVNSAAATLVTQAAFDRATVATCCVGTLNAGNNTILIRARAGAPGVLQCNAGTTRLVIIPFV